MIRMKGDHEARTPSYFAVADRLRYPMQYAASGRGGRRLREIVKQMLGPSSTNDASSRARICSRISVGVRACRMMVRGSPSPANWYEAESVRRPDMAEAGLVQRLRERSRVSRLPMWDDTTAEYRSFDCRISDGSLGSQYSPQMGEGRRVPRRDDWQVYSACKH